VFQFGRLRAALVVGSVLLSGCSGDGDAGNAPPDAANPVVTAEPSAPITTIPTPQWPLANPVPGELVSPEHLSAQVAAAYFNVQPISPEIFARMDGKSWREGAINIDQLRYLQLLHVGFDGNTYAGELVVNEAIADDVLAIFAELYNAEYQIELLLLIDNFDADDTASMNANNTSGFNHRLIAGTQTLSNHAKGLAIDLNPVQNPWVSGNSVEPEIGRPYADRSDVRPHMITHDDLAFRLFTEYGFTWGGDWRNPKDYQHFELVDWDSASARCALAQNDDSGSAGRQIHVILREDAGSRLEEQGGIFDDAAQHLAARAN